jgi:hypothetical protein
MSRRVSGVRPATEQHAVSASPTGAARQKQRCCDAEDPPPNNFATDSDPDRAVDPDVPTLLRAESSGFGASPRRPP